MHILAFFPYVLQLLLIIHILRNNKPFVWLWLLVFVPYIGGIAYIIVEILPGLTSGGAMERMGGTVADMVRPNHRIEELEQLVKRQETIANKALLADAYVAAGRSGEALALYDSCLTGPYAEDGDILFRKIGALYASGRKQEAKEAMVVFKEKHGLSSAEQVLLDLKISEDYAKMKDIFYKTNNFEAGYLCASYFHHAGNDDEVRAILSEMEDNLKSYKYLKRTDSGFWYKKTKGLLA